MKKIYLSLLIILIANFALSQNYKIKSITEADSSAKYRYYYSIKYPELTYESDPEKQDKINNRISVAIHQLRDDFLKDVKESDITDLPPEFTSEFSSDYTLYYSSDELLSFSYEIYMYFAGSAHGYGYSKVSNIDLVNVKTIEFNNMFPDTASGLKFISGYCYSDLIKQSQTKETCIWDEEMLKTSVAPEIKNFSNIAVSQDKLTLIFNPYEVACYAMGQVFVDIPYKEISGIINPSSPIYKLITK